MSPSRLQYDRIIITGASSGFGEAFAGTLAAHAAELVLIARKEDALRRLAATLEEEHPGLRATVFPCDLADEASLDTLLSHLAALPPANTLLINNAGAGDYGEFADGRWEKIRALLRLNVESLTRLCHALIPGMKRNGGDIINISSLGALLPIPDFAVYAATKAYVSSLSEALRLELREHGIRVLAVCPGPVSTGFGKAARRPGFTGNMMPGRNAFDTSIETVVKDSLRALSRGRARVFPGMKIRLAALLLNIAPLDLIRFFMGRRPRKVQAVPNDSPSSAS
ncbi:SDR family oxidoreductase [Akkermansia sp.]|uniref:SDR family NAD(P)-dependent oxidoreductase n=1 Tax=Akkermansia sp. TaxID=1872421 RepID=UPI0025C18278|nr:SDR family oxidoreductase [Akkermansia sp.]MCC8149519.1 SDR family oxidoreductase [Akkermansia sp.]